jgi:pimeloyl-ACP methyl ester carboxylesterase
MTSSRETLVMLPGTLCDRRLFGWQKRSLRHSHNIRLVDYRALKPARTQPARTRWVQGLLAGLPDRFSLAGFSLGGIWALEILRQAPDRVERLAMIASNAQGASPKGYRNSRIQRRLWRQPGAGPLAVLARGMPAYFHHAAARRRHQGLLRDMALGTGRQSALAQFAWAGSRPESLQTLAEFAGPVLIVSGARDRLCPPRWQQAMQQANPAARWLELDRTGHFVPLEAPSALTAALHQWLQTPSPAASRNLSVSGVEEC